MTSNKGVMHPVRGLVHLSALVAVCGVMVTSMLVWTGQPAGAAAATGSPLTFGVMGVDSGPYSLAEYGVAFKAYVANWNSHGGYKGHPIKIIELDGQFSPSTTADNARTLVGTDGVIGIAFDYNLLDCSVNNTFYATSHIAVIGVGMTGCYIPATDFPTQKLGGSQDGSVFVRFLHEIGAKHIGFVFPEIPGTGGIRNTVETEAKADHVKLTYEFTPLVATAAQIDAIIAQMKAQGIDSVILGVQASQNQLFLQEAALQNFAPANHISYVLGPSMYAPSNLEFTQGAYVFSYGDPWSSPEGKQVSATLERYGVKAGQLDGNSQQGYEVATEFQQVLDSIRGPVTRSSFLKAAEHTVSVHPALTPSGFTANLVHPAKDKEAGFILKSTPSGFKLVSGFIETNN